VHPPPPALHAPAGVLADWQKAPVDSHMQLLLSH
jgi:hypothetical protein